MSKGKRVLLIDDEELVVRSVKKLFEKTGFEVLVARSGEEGIAVADTQDVDFVICDVRMPGKSGIETIQAIKEGKMARKKGMPPFIFLTGYADNDLEREEEGLRPAGIVYKPFDAFKLLELVKDKIR